MTDPADREVAVFGTALQLPAGQRAAYLDEACAGDAALRQRVEAFLAAHVEAGAFLEGPASAGERPSPDEDALNQNETKRLAPAPAEKAGDRIGHYKLLQQIGEGGCGVVYMAEQEEPVRRKVALKVIKLGMDTKQVVARFEAERQALALMDHPNIAKVLDAGATGTGRPFFVMELVRGVKITDYCDQNQLLTRERLDLFVLVCKAIQHAHQKGVIHRDIKPSNILVTVNDGVPVPKVIDFGIAKATQGRLTDRTLFTAFEQFMGTPAYMSPEQAVMTSLDIDTRSDIYSLGVLLYELLTSKTPFDAQELMQAGLDEMRRTIREKEPVRPSTRLSTMQDADLTTVASHRQTEAPKLVHTLRGDLDWIVMKALEKDRARRYETCNGLARDVQRYLTDELVLARPPSNLYRLRKLVHRNKLAFAAAVVVTASLILGLGAATMAVFRVQRDNQQIRKAKDDATEKLRASYLAEARAERHSGRTGQRLASLEAVGNAAAIRPGVDARNEAIACLALPDIGVAKLAAFRSSNLDPQVRFDANLEKYAIEDGPGNITIRSAANDREIMLLPGVGLGVTWMAGFSPDGRFLAVAYSDDTWWVWDLTTQKPILQHVPGNRSSDFSPDSRVFVWNTPDGDLVFQELSRVGQTRRLHLKTSFSLLAFDPKGTRLACDRRGERMLEIRDVENGTLISTCLPSAVVPSAAWSSDGKFVATGCTDGQVYVWDAASGEKVVTLEGHTETVVCVAFNHAGDLLASASWDNSTLLWNPITGRQVVGFLGMSYGLHFSQDDRRLAAFQNGPQFGLLSVTRSGEYRRLSSVHTGDDHCGPDFSPDGRLLAAGTGGRICFWDTLSGKEVAFFQVPLSDAVLFPPDGKSFVTSDRTGLHSRSFQRLPGLAGSSYKLGAPHLLYNAPDPREAAFSLDGRHLALVVNHMEGQCLIIDLKDPSANVSLGVHPQADYIAISPDARWAATASYQNSLVKVWNAKSGELVRSLSVPARSRVVFSPDGRWLATSSTEYQLWEVGSWRPKAPIPGHPFAHLNALAFSPDSSIIALVEEGRNIQLLETLTGRPLAKLEAPDGARIASLRFSPDGTQLAALELNRQLQLWDLCLVRKALKQARLDWELPPYAREDRSRSSVDATLAIEPEGGLGSFATPELARTIPARDPQANTNLIDLGPYYNSALIPRGYLSAVNLFDLTQGIQTLAGVSFDVRGLIQVGEPTMTGPKYPLKVSGIALGRTCRRLHFLYGATSVASAPDGAQIGSYVLHYANDRSVEIPILATKLLAGSSTAPHQDETSTVAWRSQPAETHRTGNTFCLVRTTWENPFPADAIASLDFLSHPPGPAPFLVAITAE